MASYFDVRLRYPDADQICYQPFYGELSAIKTFVTKYFVDNRGKNEPKCYPVINEVSILTLNNAKDEDELYRVTMPTHHLYVKGPFESVKQFFASDTTARFVVVKCISITQAEVDEFLSMEETITKLSCPFPVEAEQLGAKLASKLKQKDVSFRRDAQTTPKSWLTWARYTIGYYLS